MAERCFGQVKARLERERDEALANLEEAENLLVEARAGQHEALAQVAVLARRIELMAEHTYDSECKRWALEAASKVPAKARALLDQLQRAEAAVEAARTIGDSFFRAKESDAAWEEKW